MPNGSPLALFTQANHTESMGANTAEVSEKTFDVRRVKKIPSTVLNRSNFWREKPIEARFHPSYSYLAYSLICVAAFLVAALATILINASRSTKPSHQSIDGSLDQTYQSQTKPGDKNPFIDDNQTTSVEPPSTTPDQPNQPKSLEIDKKTIRLRVLNGSGVTGDAAKTKTELEQKGFVVPSVGNAKFNYTQTQIYYLAGKNNEADLVAKDLTNKEVKKSEAAQSVIGDNIDVLVVVGKR